MIYLSIDKKVKEKFIYQQIYEEIKKNILIGRIQPNEKLLPKRVLAHQLKVSLNSVINAYDQLLAEGYIYTLERKGYFAERIQAFVSQEEILNPLPADLKESVTDKSGWISLSHMTANTSDFPFKEWIRSQQKAILVHQNELSEIIHPQGPYIVRETIARLVAFNRGVICEPEQVVIGDGTISLIRQLMDIQNKNSVISIENPGYQRLYKLLERMKFQVLPVNMDNKGIKIKEIQPSHFVFVTPSHQFPTGIIMPISRRIELLNWASEGEDRYIVEDDYDSEFKYETDNIPSLQSLDRNQRVIYIGTFSKTMLPGLRISYMVLPPKLLRIYRHKYADLMQPSNTLNLFALHYFIESGGYQKHVKRMNSYYETKRKILIKELTNRFGDNLQIDNIPAGLHIFIHIKSNKDYEEIEERARQLRLEIYTMKRFLLTENKQKSGLINLVIGFANLPEDKIKEAVNRLFQVFH
ncbi:MocR-like transcriptional regulator GabR [Cytobacillus kochii]|uniref:MocR-like transcriptional regulator GabR n=1 Tax=Cytobacillus kochii TaxID=859143 RepID=UPI0025A04D16|nr:PLP-dependent aminotransferase family protein [Cytobacillus kochii]MDM5209463.1 PLP-dependent aminotransferase family protein [Cytobacillus kochii]